VAGWLSPSSLPRLPEPATSTPLCRSQLARQVPPKPDAEAEREPAPHTHIKQRRQGFPYRRASMQRTAWGGDLNGGSFEARLCNPSIPHHAGDGKGLSRQRNKAALGYHGSPNPRMAAACSSRILCMSNISIASERGSLWPAAICRRASMAAFPQSSRFFFSV